MAGDSSPSERGGTVEGISPQQAKSGKKKGNGSSLFCRLVVQRIDKASILLDNTSLWEDVGFGYVVFVAFLVGADEGTVDRIVNTLFSLKHLLPPTVPQASAEVSSSPPPAAVSLSECPSDISVLLVPQSTLGGRMKGAAMQFHSLIDKSRGEELYDKLKLEMQKKVSEQTAKRITITSGVYGNRQGLRLESAGPSTIQLEL
eukprot:GHVS01056179.1.p1 GENE.GHVS01056179.1~~GHVS01056179.1.p1  ORF type:complete len:202 (-),score=32.12 GHVS01056179.1:1064-1669(-)